MPWDIPGLRSLWFSTPEIKVSSPAKGVSDSSLIKTLRFKSLCSSQKIFFFYFLRDHKEFGMTKFLWDEGQLNAFGEDHLVFRYQV